MLSSLRLLLCLVVRLFCSQRNLLLENIALRQQLLTLKRKNPKPRLSHFDRLFWVIARQVWSAWKQALVIVTPQTVVHWHQAAFQLYWNWLSRHRKVLGRKPISKEVRNLIFRMVAENPTWGAPRIHGELLKLGFDLSERTVSRWGAESSEEPRISKTLASLPRPSPRSHRCDGFLHCSNNHLRRPVLLLRDRP
jgi:putative transposase